MTQTNAQTQEQAMQEYISGSFDDYRARIAKAAQRVYDIDVLDFVLIILEMNTPEAKKKKTTK